MQEPVQVEEKVKKKFCITWKWRSLVSFYLLFVSFGLLITGIALYVSPPGRFANAVVWRFLGFTKEQWTAIHTVSAYFVAICSFWHLALNWKQLLSYLRSGAHRVYRFKAEFGVALLLTALAWFGAVFNVPPFSYMMTLSDVISDSWVEAVPTPEVLGEAVESDKDGGAAPLSPSAWGEGAAPNFGASDIGEDHGESVSVSWGQLTVEEVCLQQGIALADAKARLAAYGVTTDTGQLIRYLADTSGYEPSEVTDIIQGMEPGAHNEYDELGN